MTAFLELWRFNARLALSAISAVALLRLLLFIVPFRLLNRVLGDRQNAGAAPASGDRARRLRIAQAVRISSRLVPGASCLTQAFSTKLLLRMRGDDAELLFGATRKSNGAFQAHAWLEKDGEILIGGLPELDQYRRFSERALPT